MADPRKCYDCRWWRSQAGSAHAMCPRQSDFSFTWASIAPECDIYAEVLQGETVRRDGVNQFAYWSGIDRGTMPTAEQIARWFAEHPRTEAPAAAGQDGRE